MNQFNSTIHFFARLTLGLTLAGAVLAQDTYPNKPIRMLLGYPPGGGSDIIARLVAKPLGDRLGQSVVVDNKPGAGGNIAAEMVARAAPDGYTLLFVPSGLASAAAMKKSMPFQPVNDFIWLSTVTTYPLALAVTPQSPIKSFADLVSRAKAEPSKITYSSVGIGSAMHLATEWIQAETGITLNHIPFKGGTGPMTELLAGRLDVMVDTMTFGLAQVAGGKVRALAITSRDPLPALPGVPSIASALPELEYESWIGVLGPRNLPRRVMDRIHRGVQEVIAMPDVSARIRDLGALPRGSSPEEFRTRSEREIARFKTIVAARRIPME